MPTVKLILQFRIRFQSLSFPRVLLGLSKASPFAWPYPAKFVGFWIEVSLVAFKSTVKKDVPVVRHGSELPMPALRS